MARSEDEDAETVLVQHRRLIESVARRVCAGHPDDVDDVVQEASLRIVRALHTVRHRGALVAWIMQTTRRAGIDYLSRGRGMRSTAVPLEQTGFDDDGHVVPMALRVDPVLPDEDDHVEATRRRVREEVDALPDLERRAVKARFRFPDSADASLRHVATATGTSIETVKRASSRGQARLRVRLWPHPDDHDEYPS